MSRPGVDYSAIETALSVVQAGSGVRNFLRDTHAKAYEADHLMGGVLKLSPIPDLNRCVSLYTLLLATKACTVVEAGSSCGIRTIYIALAVAQNAAAYNAPQHGVLAAEVDPSQAAEARENWQMAGKEIKRSIYQQEGDVQESLSMRVPENLDFLLLDVYATHPVIALKIVRPYLRFGAMVVADNAFEFLTGYQELLAYLGNPANEFKYVGFGGMIIAVSSKRQAPSGFPKAVAGWSDGIE
ncbi:S-adenosyl-L-methionine-dependent methyltransferase [Hypoxylon sp. FL1150]|nr:S-adenosyl-L-methionine-dependent methyltransferase [Hypoxylon sp. FL1150]